MTGETQSQDFPTTPGVLQEHAGNRICLERSCTDAFVTKIDPRTPAIVYSTYLFGELDDYGTGIAVDGAGNAFVVGTTISRYFPIRNAFQQVSPGPPMRSSRSSPRTARGSSTPRTSAAAIPATVPQTGYGRQGSAIALDAAGNA